MPTEVVRHDAVLAAAQVHPDAESIACEVFLTAIQNGSTIQTLMDGYLEKFRLSSPGFAILLLLGVDEPIVRRPSELASHLRVSRATMTGLLDTLERAGFSRRMINPTDRRSMLIESTPASREHIRRIIPGCLRLLGTITDTLTAEECADFIRICRKIQGNLASPA